MGNNEKNLEMAASSNFIRDLNTIPFCSNWVRRNCSTRNVAIRSRRRSLPFTPTSGKLLCLLETAPQTVPGSKSSSKELCYHETTTRSQIIERCNTFPGPQFACYLNKTRGLEHAPVLAPWRPKGSCIRSALPALTSLMSRRAWTTQKEVQF